MFNKIQNFWQSFWYGFIEKQYNKSYRHICHSATQPYTDTRRINFLAVFAQKLSNLVNTEATFDVECISRRAERLAELCKSLEDDRFTITEDMLGNGDVWVFPATDACGRLYHRYLTQDKARVLNMEGGEVSDLVGIIDVYIDSDNRTYLLNRRHTLNHRTLTISTYTTDEHNQRVHFDKWADFEGTYQLKPVDFIGVGRFKSPVSGRGRSPVYGVPLSFGCEEIEKKCFNDLKLIETEFERAESKLFADGRVLRKFKGDSGSEFKLFEGVYSVERRAGESGGLVDIFSPEIRYSAYYSKLLNDLAQYEQLIGTDRGFLTPFESGHSATATEIRRANASTIALLDKIRTAVKRGVEQTIASDALFLNIPPDLYALKFDFYDPFTDEAEQYKRIANAVDRGVAEKDDELLWLFPNLTKDERTRKLERIAEERKDATDAAIERMMR